MRCRSRSVTRALLLTVAALGIALGVSMWRPAAQKPPASAAVRMLDTSQLVGAAPGEKGATYYWLEGQGSRMTVRFTDAVAVAERVTAGEIHARLTDASGTELATLHATPVNESNTVLQYRTRDDALLRAATEGRVRPTLDWTARQAYSLYKDRVKGTSAPLEWQDGMMRPAGAGRRSLARDVVEVQTDWAKGMSAKATRKVAPHGLAYKGHAVEGDVFTTHLTIDGTDVGLSTWYAGVQVLAWDVPGLSKGTIGPDQLRGLYRGWPFTPDMEWLNLQTIAFHHFKTQIDRNGFVASRRSNPVLQFFAPTLRANEPGCDGLHWLDGTILRYCCDMHDSCYSKSGCAWTSWWMFWSSWSCDVCNIGAVACFTAELDTILHPIP